MPSTPDDYTNQSTRTGSPLGVNDISSSKLNVRFKHPTGGWWNTAQSFTGTCPSGYSGGPLTLTVAARSIFSYISQEDANARARQEAQEAVERELVCELLYFNDRQQVLLICPAGQVGDAYVSIVASGSVSSPISVADANTIAFNLAVTQGEASIVCVIEPSGTCAPTGGNDYQDSLGPELECLVL